MVRWAWVALALVNAPLTVAALGVAPPEECATASYDRYEVLETLPGLPSGWTPMLGWDASRIPAIPSVLASGVGGICDLTQDLGAFVDRAGPSEGVDLAALAASTSHPDQLGIPQPRSMEVIGSQARLQTWSEKDGLVVDWTVDLETLDARFVVVAVGTGDVKSDLEGWHPWVGFSTETLEAFGSPAAASTKTLLAANADGSQWKITYFTQNYASEAQADAYGAAYAQAAQDIHAIEVGQWGFSSVDLDNVYDITVDGCSCIFAGDNVNIHIHPKLEDLFALFNPPLQYPSNQHFYRSVIGHEWHHHLQWSIQEWALGDALIEGGARFAETVFEPEANHQPRSIHYLNNINGFSSMMSSPNTMISQRAYNFGLFYGFVYSVDGGIPLLKRIYEESLNVAGGDNTAIPDAVSRALDDFPGPHDTFDEAYADFALQMYKKSFVWAKADGADPRDWGLFLPPVSHVAFSLGQATAGAVNLLEANVNARGILFGNITREGPLVTQYVGVPNLNARWVWTTPAGVSVHAADPVFVIDDPVLQKASFVIIRDAGQQNLYRAAVEAPSQLL